MSETLVQPSALGLSRPRSAGATRGGAGVVSFSLLLGPKPHRDPLKEFGLPFGRGGCDRRRDVSGH
jgi:hypothetical protein